MIKHDLIQKNSLAHGLLSSPSHPNIIIPVKLIIKNIKFDENNPKYLAKIIKFYDNIAFLKKHFMNAIFINKFGNRAKPFIFDVSKFNETGQFENHIDKGEEKYYVVLDSIMVVRYKNDMMDLYNKIQKYLIIKNIQELRELCTRISYNTGQFYIDTKYDFHERLRLMLADKIGKTKEDFDNFIMYL